MSTFATDLEDTLPYSEQVVIYVQNLSPVHKQDGTPLKLRPSGAWQICFIMFIIIIIIITTTTTTTTVTSEI